MDPLDRKARNARLRLIGIGALAAAVLLGGGVLIGVSLSGGADGSTSESADNKPTPTPSASSKARMTPAKGKPVKLIKPKGQKNGAYIGFPHHPDGAISAAVYYWENYAFLDDIQARKQLEVLTSKDSPDFIDKAISRVRKLRERAGLPPSGPTPAGLTFTTTVNAVRGRSMTDDGNVVHVWMNYDQHATLPDGQPNGEPLKSEDTDVILKWEDGDWKITEEPQYVKQRTFPVAYFPDSPFAWEDGWWRVEHAD